MSDPRPVLVVNPRAGGGRAGQTFPAMRRTIEKALGPIDALFTERAGHAIELARGAANGGATLIVAVGGDGTFNEVVNGVLAAEPARREHVAVGIIGQGTGGDLLRVLGIEHRLDRYIEAIASGRTRKVDVGRARYTKHDGTRGERYFVNILSVGMGGLVDQYVATASRALGGKAAYFGASLKALARSREGRLRTSLSWAGETSEHRIASYMLAVCNGRYFGSGMKVAPMAEIDDGRFEVVSIGGPSKFAFAMTSQKIYQGEHLGKPGVVHLPCDKIFVDLENEDARSVFLIDLDGEPVGQLPLEIEVRPQAITLRC
ncbi:diacylglycerol kinase family lipid kinase [Pendulispora rubella]|uniref:Diacylglycerol kinase family lipid kinase n=1 Tax=Pendulispora rubella TaxID=2741070 RepID=A0ABZ2KZG8_9BACT